MPTLVRNELTKQAGDTVRLACDFGDVPEIIAGATISSCTISASTPSGVTNSSQVTGTYKVSALFAGGTAGTDYTITFTATLSAGSIIARTCTLHVI